MISHAPCFYAGAMDRSNSAFKCAWRLLRTAQSRPWIIIAAAGIVGAALKLDCAATTFGSCDVPIIYRFGQIVDVFGLDCMYRLDSHLWALILFALSPLAFMVSGFHGNVDPIMVCLLLMATYSCVEDSVSPSALFLAPWPAGLKSLLCSWSLRFSSFG
jgi:hypothetical protein